MRTKHLVFRHAPIPFDPKYPKAYRGSTYLALRVLDTALRLSWYYRKCENDWQRVDTATTWNISPRWAKWFHVYGYYAGNGRYMYHFGIGQTHFSVMPLNGQTLGMLI